MFGCIKTILKIGVLVLALIGFQTIGGFEWVQSMWEKYHAPKDTNAELEKALQIADITKAGDDYKFVRNASMLGYDVVISRHNESDQKLLILENKTKEKNLLTQDDIINNRGKKWT